MYARLHHYRGYNARYKITTPIPKNHAFIFDMGTILKLERHMAVFYVVISNGERL
jgi:hypothetical protein